MARFLLSTWTAVAAYRAGAVMWMETRLRRRVPFLIVALAVAPAAAETAATPGGKDERTTQVRFQADQVELSSDPEAIDLSGNVQIRAARYRLSGKRLRLQRTPRGIVVDGSGRVAFCPCEDAPVTIGFRSALVAPPTDLVLKHPTLRVGDVPILWLPYLWLRSPRRIGVLPPTVRWSQEDGFFASTGVHLPLRGGGSTDWRAGGYVRGGGQIDVTTETVGSTSRVRWDFLDSSSLTVQGRGATQPLHSSTVAFQVDALRGERAVRGPTDVEDVAQRYDRAAIAATTLGNAWAGSVGGRGDLERATPVDAFGTWGPAGAVSWYRGVGHRGLVDGAVRTRSMATADGGTLTSLAGGAGIGTHGRIGPVAASSHLRSRGLIAVGDSNEQQAAAAGTYSELGLPLVRTFGTGPQALSHWVHPFVEGGVGVGEQNDVSLLPWLYPDGLFMHAAVGARSTLGRLSRRSGFSLEGRIGWVGIRSDSDVFAAWRAVAGGRWLGLDAEGIASPETRALATRSTLRAGPHDSLNATLKAEGQLRALPPLGRLAETGGWDAPMRDWFDTAGWTLAPALSVPWVSWLATSADIVYDLGQRQWVSVRGAAAYRHPCGCFALVAWAGQRVGREGLDAWISVDLMPR